MDDNPYKSPEAYSEPLAREPEHAALVDYDYDDDDLYFASVWDSLTFWNLVGCAAAIAGPLVAWYVVSN